MDAASLLSPVVTRLSITSEYGPDIVIDQPFSSATVQGDSAFLSRLKPRVDVEFVGGGHYTSAPYGEPGPTKWGLIAPFTGLGGGLLIALAAYGAYRLVRPARCG